MIAQPTIQPKKSPRKPSSQPKTKKPRLGVPMYIPTPPPSVDEGMLPSKPVDESSDNIEVILHQLVEEQHENASLREGMFPSELIVDEGMLPSEPIVGSSRDDARKELSVSCDCGGVYNSKTKAKHFKTIKHMKFAGVSVESQPV